MMVCSEHEEAVKIYQLHAARVCMATAGESRGRHYIAKININ